MNGLDFPSTARDPHLPRAVLGHLWRPQTAMEIARGTGFRYEDVRGALFALRLAGLAVRRPVVRGGYGSRWRWVKT